jgi:Protein of unknown function (DUF3131)
MIRDFEPPSRQLAMLAHLGGVASAIAIILGLRTGINLTAPKQLDQPVIQELSASAIAKLDATSQQHPAFTVKNTSSEFSIPEGVAQRAWLYFQANWNPETGFVNAVDQTQFVTMSDVAATLAALVSAKELNIISETEFNQKITRLLKTLVTLKLCQGELPNRYYNAKTGQPIGLGNLNQTQEVGWSALEIGRLARWLKIVGGRYPKLRSLTEEIWNSWRAESLTQDGQLHGLTITQEQELYQPQGSLGYEEYAAYGLKLWGLPVEQSLNTESRIGFVNLYGQKVPHDTRKSLDETGRAVVSTPYILDGIESGFQALPKVYADLVFTAQAARYEVTHQLTALTEERLDRAPNFLYNALYTKETPWNALYQKQSYSDFRVLSAKAAIGWHVLYRTTYSQKMVEFISANLDSDRGWQGGFYETLKQPNQVLTADTNSVILESLLYQKVRQPLLDWAGVPKANSARAIAHSLTRR